MLKEGQNLNEIELGLLVQLDGEVGSFIQKTGRILRGKDPILILLYYKGTRDEVYLQTALSEVDENHIKIINDINNLIL